MKAVRSIVKFLKFLVYRYFHLKIKAISKKLAININTINFDVIKG